MVERDPREIHHVVHEPGRHDLTTEPVTTDRVREPLAQDAREVGEEVRVERRIVREVGVQDLLDIGVLRVGDHDRELRRPQAAPVRLAFSDLLVGRQVLQRPVEVPLGFELTRQCLEILLQHDFPITILTKSALARRDLDLLAGKNNVDFGVTITTLDESLSKLFEPKSSPPAERLALVKEAKKKGITTYVLLGPLMPHLSDTEKSLGSLLNAVKEVKETVNDVHSIWLNAIGG